MDGDNSDERFAPTSGRVLGVLAVVTGLGLGGSALFTGDRYGLTVAAVGVLFAALAWAAMLRPVVGIEGDVLVLRNMLDTVRVPLAAVEEVAVRQVLVVRAGDKRYTSPAVGRPRRQLHKESLAGRREGGEIVDGANYAVFVEGRIRERAREARESLGVRLASPEQVALGADVTRDPALPEILVLLLALAAVVGLIVV